MTRGSGNPARPAVIADDAVFRAVASVGIGCERGIEPGAQPRQVVRMNVGEKFLAREGFGVEPEQFECACIRPQHVGGQIVPPGAHPGRLVCKAQVLLVLLAALLGLHLRSDGGQLLAVRFVAGARCAFGHADQRIDEDAGRGHVGPALASLVARELAGVVQECIEQVIAPRDPYRSHGGIEAGQQHSDAMLEPRQEMTRNEQRRDRSNGSCTSTDGSHRGWPTRFRCRPETRKA